MPTLTAAEFRCTRERLGLPIRWVAEELGVQERSVSRWEDGTHPVPQGVADTMKVWAAAADALYREVSVVHPNGEAFRTYRTDADYRPTGMIDWPASWHRAIAGRLVADGWAVDYA
jgi:predicted transcriptional regulator